MSTKILPSSKLILDYGIYPRQHIDPTNLHHIIEAVEQGEDLPPVIADAKSFRVIDGFHRVTEAQRRDAPIKVMLIEYATDEAMVIDSVTRNARHGAPLTSFDRARIVTLADEFKINPDIIAKAMAVSVATVDKIRISRTAFAGSGAKITVKRPLRHLAGAHLTEEQMAANEKSSGWPASFHAEQLILLLETDLVDLEDERNRSSLDRLFRCLEAHLVSA